MHYKQFKKYIVFILLMTASILFSQFIEVEVDVDLRRLSEGDRQLLHSLEDDIKEYFLNTEFFSDASDLELIINFRLVLESVLTSGSQTTINAQAITTNKLDQYFYAKGIQFPYYKGYKIRIR